MAKIAILLEQKYEDLELQYPRLRLIEAGHQVEVIAPKLGEKYLGKWGYPQAADKPSKDAAAAKIPMAAICHGPWMLCSTDALRGRRCTSFFAIAHDVVNAGGQWADEECVVDGPIITSRCPDDLPAFTQAILRMVSGEGAKGSKGKPIAPAWLKETIK